MIWIRSNSWGLAMIVVGGLIAGVGSFVLKVADAPVLMSVGVVLIVMDVIIRARVRNQPGWLVQRRWGGHLWFVPIWAIGVVVFVVNLLKAFNA
jgi:hypothetical protein